MPNIYGEGWLGMFGGHPRDLRNAMGGDKYAIGRTASKGLPFPLSLFANLGINKAERNAINKYENSSTFEGAPRNYNSAQYLPPGLARDEQGYYYKNPSAVGPPPAPPPPALPRFRGSTSGSGIGHGWSSANDSQMMGMVMDSLGLANAGTQIPDGAKVWLSKAVK